MGEVVKFPGGDRSEKGLKKEIPEDAVFHRLSLETQGNLIEMIKTANSSSSFSSGDVRFNEARILVRDWKEEQTVDFLENSANREILKSKPYLLVALFEKALGQV